jgi:formylglycine-generating enzyme
MRLAPVPLAVPLLSLLVASLASAVTMDWVPVGNPGNACQLSDDAGGGQGCYGGVSYTYSIGTYEVTNAQYAEFLNAKAASDPLGLYSRLMDPAVNESGGIARSGSSGSYTYSAIAERENMPVNWVNFYRALRFANWMNNGQGNGDTETGAYTLLGGGPIPSNADTVTRNLGATIVLPTEDEWYKAAYYDPKSTTYFDWPTRSNTRPECALPTATPNRANCQSAVGHLTGVGVYTGSPSPNGTFDQGGNVWEWEETIISGRRGIRGGAFGPYNDPAGISLNRNGRNYKLPSDPSFNLGFRVAMIPGPSTGGLSSLAGAGGLAPGQRRNRSCPTAKNVDDESSPITRTMTCHRSASRPLDRI